MSDEREPWMPSLEELDLAYNADGDRPFSDCSFPALDTLIRRAALTRAVEELERMKHEFCWPDTTYNDLVPSRLAALRAELEEIEPKEGA